MKLKNKSSLRTTLVLVFSIIIIFSSSCSKTTSREEPTPTPLPTSPALAKPTYAVQKGDVVEQIQFSGRISPAVSKPVYFRNPGRIQKIYIERGNTVTAGQILADLEGIDQLQRQLALIQLNVRRNQIYLEIAQINLDLYKKQTPKWTQGYADELKIKERELELAQISVEEAGLDMKNVQVSISNTQLIAPMDGTVLSVSMSEGREIQAYQTVATIADLTQFEISASLLSDVLGKLTEGMIVSIIPHGGIGKESTGYVRVLPYPYGTGGTNTTPEEKDESTRIAFDKSAIDAGYQLGDLVYVNVILQQKTDALWLPPQAIRLFEGRRFVVVQDGEIQRRVDVKVGIQGDERVEILEGVSEGQIVVGP